MATLEELSETGYAALTMERVATRARTGKAALYRRWSNRAELVVDACALAGFSQIEMPNTGALREDVIALMRQIAAKMTSPLGGILRGLLAEMTRDPEFAALIRKRLHTAGPASLRNILERAVERGEIEAWILDSRRATVATDLLRNEFLIFGTPVTDDAITDIVDNVYLPLVRRPAPR
ncbi:TetR/AcrR family transcriptional regulator [Streptomyces sp. NPDC056149]|uniref:TetR/AcrR family transcriptional regulator n=1 Tax=unclassified Streptomyces TaxID=2593676 RepID=UPI0023813DA5|nr:TetR/AcrR family transcriptional regulator [Streptomyces sp. WZ-12]